MGRRANIELSRTVSHALRHAPWLYELEPDEAGWVAAEALLDGLRRRKRWRDLTMAELEAMVVSNDKRRYELRDGLIRALYGHSLAGKLARDRAVPPPVLYHGTAPETLPAIREHGLLPMSRQYVHLSTDVPIARQVGGRKAAQPVILHVDAAGAHRDGITFYRGNDLIWLADRIPPRYIEVESRET